MMTGTFTVVPSPRIEELLKTALAGIAADIGALELPGLRAVVLGGGYGRGEGGVLHTETGDALYNDLDFFVFASGAGRALMDRIDRALRELARPWTEKLGVAVDFGPVKNCGTLKKVASTLMFQELLRGWKPVWGTPELEKWIPAADSRELPFSEAARLLLNRGMGLVFAGERLRAGDTDADFIVRNMNKALLGAGDALLIAAGEYRWRGPERVNRFRAWAAEEKLPAEYVALYEKAFRFKLEPLPVLPEDPGSQWRKCREFYLDAVRRAAGVRNDADVSRGLSRRAAKEGSLKELLRWARRTFGVRPGRAMFEPPVVTLLGRVFGLLAGAEEELPLCPPELRRLWSVFN
ncbi:MAG: hypothetical protein IJT50_09900 [Lentisphaeria bacterium]|nr:hypothetical protein [Lentisphaeria bacterium]